MEQNIKLKYIKKAMMLHGEQHKFEEDEKILDFSRHLGHKYEMPGQGQWTMQTDPQKPCWVCG